MNILRIFVSAVIMLSLDLIYLDGTRNTLKQFLQKYRVRALYDTLRHFYVTWQ